MLVLWGDIFGNNVFDFQSSRLHCKTRFYENVCFCKITHKNKVQIELLIDILVDLGLDVGLRTVESCHQV